MSDDTYKYYIQGGILFAEHPSGDARRSIRKATEKDFKRYENLDEEPVVNAIARGASSLWDTVVGGVKEGSFRSKKYGGKVSRKAGRSAETS